MVNLLCDLACVPGWVPTLIFKVLHDLAEPTRVLLPQLLHDIVQCQTTWVDMSVHLHNLIFKLTFDAGKTADFLFKRLDLILGFENCVLRCGNLPLFNFQLGLELFKFFHPSVARLLFEKWLSHNSIELIL